MAYDKYFRIPDALIWSLINRRKTINGYKKLLNPSRDAEKLKILDEISVAFENLPIKVVTLRTILALLKLVNNESYAKVSKGTGNRIYGIKLKNKTPLFDAAGYKMMFNSQKARRHSDRVKDEVMCQLQILSKEPFPIVCRIEDKVIAVNNPIIEIVDNLNGLDINLSPALTYEFENKSRLVPENFIELMSINDHKRNLSVSTILAVIYTLTVHGSKYYNKQTPISWSKLAEKLKLTKYLKNRNYDAVKKTIDIGLATARRMKFIRGFKFNEQNPDQLVIWPNTWFSDGIYATPTPVIPKTNQLINHGILSEEARKVEQIFTELEARRAGGRRVVKGFKA